MSRKQERLFTFGGEFLGIFEFNGIKQFVHYLHIMSEQLFYSSFEEIQVGNGEYFENDDE